MLLDALQLQILFLVALLLPLIVQMLVLYVISRALWNLAQRRYGRGIWAALAVVGVSMHELSHAAAFLVTGAGVRRMVLFKPRGLPDYGSATGVVVPQREPSVIGRALASIAPFFGCSLAAYLVLRLLLPDIALETQLAELTLTDLQSEGLLPAVGVVLGAFLNGTLDAIFQLDPFDPRTYLALYLGASLGLGAAPSRDDLKLFFPALLAVLALLFPIFVLVQGAGTSAAAFDLVRSILGRGLLIVNTALVYAVVFSLIALALMAMLALMLRR
ncbi:MAG: hypothetical protein GYB64_10705 [Chloroflexi bacterium]|nr:hypothetical protein [Chloroflexota bacterium]